jgi:hypothetical protein
MLTLRLFRSAFLPGFVLASAAVSGDCRAQQCGEKSCCRPPAADAAAAAAPAEDDEPATVAPGRPAVFTAPAPTGEILGARHSLGLPSLRISLPKMTFETPEFSWQGFSRGRREAQMQLDGATAPVSHQEPLLFGQLAGSAAAAPAQTRPARTAPAETAPANVAPAPCTPEGCLSSLQDPQRKRLEQQVMELQALVEHLAKQKGAVASQDSAATVSQNLFPEEKWESAADIQVRQYRQHVAGLESQILELQKLVEQLAAQKAAAPELPETAKEPVRKRSRSIDPWTEGEETETLPKQEVADSSQAERIAMLEAQIAALQAKDPRTEQRLPGETAEPLIPRSKLAVQQTSISNESQASVKPASNSGILRKLAASFGQR